jgi:hypothetical protein
MDPDWVCSLGGDRVRLPYSSSGLVFGYLFFQQGIARQEVLSTTRAA